MYIPILLLLLLLLALKTLRVCHLCDVTCESCQAWSQYQASQAEELQALTETAGRPRSKGSWILCWVKRLNQWLNQFFFSPPYFEKEFSNQKRSFLLKLLH